MVANFGFIIAVKRQKIDGQRGLKRNNYYTSHTQRGNYPAIRVMPSQQFNLVPVVQTLDSAIQWKNLYPLDSAIGFPNTYPLDSAIQRLNNRGLNCNINTSGWQKAEQQTITTRTQVLLQMLKQQTPPHLPHHQKKGSVGGRGRSGQVR